MNEIGGQLGKTLKESARILYQDHGCPKELIETIAAISQLSTASEMITPAQGMVGGTPLTGRPGARNL